MYSVNQLSRTGYATCFWSNNKSCHVP